MSQVKILPRVLMETPEEKLKNSPHFRVSVILESCSRLGPEINRELEAYCEDQANGSMHAFSIDDDTRENYPHLTKLLTEHGLTDCDIHWNW